MNAGIMHCLVGNFGSKTLCVQPRAVMATTRDEFSGWPRRCAKCEAKLEAWYARRADASRNTRGPDQGWVG